jgi:chitin synthase
LGGCYRSRLRKIKREERRRRDFERSFGTQQYHLSTPGGSEYGGGDTVSMVSSEDDRWGLAIGNYDLTDIARPPVGLYPVDDAGSSVDGGGTTVNGDELGMILEHGWTDEDQFVEHKLPSPSPNLIPPPSARTSPSGFLLDPHQHPHHHHHSPYQYQSSSNDNSRSHSPVNHPRPPIRYRLEDS